ncbi:hypothetical protein EC991_008079 [Linnemannia zychae]|nr:hypothetical protein EC991_008079 [Linnemannia zychae]
MQDCHQHKDPVSSRALSIPEILQAVGDQLYLALDYTKYTWVADSEKIASLLICIRVSKLWFRTFHPILWYSYNPKIMYGFTKEALQINTPHLRVVVIIGELIQQLHCSHLVILELPKSYTQHRKRDLPIERELVRANRGLKRLVWEGLQVSDTFILQKDDFTELQYLQELILSRWDNISMPFIDILRPMANTLTTLNLRYIKRFSVGNLKDANDVSSAQVILPQLETILIDAYRFEHLRRVLPSVIQELVVASPNLRTLGLKLHLVDDLNEARVLARSLRKHCPKFQNLTIHCTYHNFEDDSVSVATAIDFILECSAVGLTRLTVWDAPWHDNDLFSAIVSHAGTLEDLEISWAIKGYTGSDTRAGAERVLQLLTQCHRLQRFMVSDVPLGDLGDAFDLWKSQQWRCIELESFEIKFSWFGDDDDVEGSDDEDHDDEMEAISSTNPVMGWYLHDKESKRPPFLGIVKELFKIVQPLQHIQTLIVGKAEYTRSSVPSVRRAR